MVRSICITFAPALALLACTSPSPEGAGDVGGMGGSLPESEGGGFDAFRGPQCYFDDDCNFSALDGGACMEGACVPHPAGWCFSASECPQPADLSCASATCDPFTNTCGVFNYMQGVPCGLASPPHVCDGNGTCVPAP
jgi:hypothetical protein